MKSQAKAKLKSSGRLIK